MEVVIKNTEHQQNIVPFTLGNFPRLGLPRRSQMPTGQRPIKNEEKQTDRQQAPNQVKGRYHDQG